MRGPGQAIGIRPDSHFTAPEPELAVVLGSRGRIAGYTLANDVSAWDIERENALYLPQSKVYDGCCALGPVIVPADDLPDPYALEMTCTITATAGNCSRAAFPSASCTAKSRRSSSICCAPTTCPCGTVLLTGTGIIVPQEAALAPGDVVTIRVPEIGELSNPAALVE